MKSAAVRSWLVCFFTVLLVGLMNIDNVFSWYANKGGGREEVLSALTELKRVHGETGIGPWLNRLECAAGFAFEGSYKDKSKCRNAMEAREVVSGENIVASSSTPHEPAALARFELKGDDETALQYARLEDGIGSLPAEEAFDATPGGDGSGTSQSHGGGETGLSAGQTGITSVQEGPTDLAESQSVLLVGDSLAHGLALSLGRDLKKRNGTAFAYFAKVASGLNNPNVINWEKTVPSLIANGNPDVVLIMMGVNDANNHIREDGKLCVVGTPEWARAYENRVESFLRTVSRNHVRMYWIGVPVIREDVLQSRVSLANSAAASACSRVAGCGFLDTSNTLCDANRKYTNFLKEPDGSSVRIRTKDGIHFTAQGGDLLSRHILNELDDEGKRFHSARN
jgi:lysophospholipase L1-like esterase